MNMVMKMKYMFKQDDHEAIKAARKKNRDKQTDKRLEVLELRCEGMTQEAIAEATGYHRSHVSNLIRKYFEEGLESVAEKHYLGNRRNMSIEEEPRKPQKGKYCLCRRWPLTMRKELVTVLAAAKYIAYYIVTSGEK